MYTHRYINTKPIEKHFEDSKVSLRAISNGLHFGALLSLSLSFSFCLYTTLSISALNLTFMIIALKEELGDEIERKSERNEKRQDNTTAACVYILKFEGDFREQHRRKPVNFIILWYTHRVYNIYTE